MLEVNCPDDDTLASLLAGILPARLAGDKRGTRTGRSSSPQAADFRVLAEAETDADCGQSCARCRVAHPYLMWALYAVPSHDLCFWGDLHLEYVQ